MKLRLLIGALIAPLLFAQSASALSCMRPDLGQSMEQAKASEKLYYIFVGKFRPQYSQRGHQKPQPPKDYYDNNPKPVQATLMFDGRGLGQNPWQDAAFTGYPVEVQTSCAGPWCGAVPQTDTQVIAFVEARPGQSPLLRIGPCPQWVFQMNAAPNPVQTLRECFDKTCKTEPHWPR